MKDKKKEIRNSIIKWAVIFIILIIVYFWKQDLIMDAVENIKSIPVYASILCVVMTLAYFSVEGLIISDMTRYETKKLPWHKGFLCGLFCAFYRLITLGSGSGFAEIYYYNSNGVAVSKGTGMTLVQYTFQKIAIGIFGILSFIFLYFSGQKGIVKYSGYMLLGISVITVVVVVLVAIAVSKKLADIVIRLAEKFLKEGTKFHSKLDSIRNNVINFNSEGRRIWSHKGQFAFIVLLNFLKFICWYSIPGILLAQQFSVSIPQCIALMAVTNMISCVMLTPSGIGALEFVFCLLFSTIVTEEAAAASLILYRFYTWILPFVIGAVIAGLHKKTKVIEGETL